MSTATTTPTTTAAATAAPRVAAPASARQAARGRATTREPGDRLAMTALVLGGTATLGVVAWAGWLISQIQVPI